MIAVSPFSRLRTRGVPGNATRSPNLLFDMRGVGRGVNTGSIQRTSVGNNFNFEQNLTGIDLVNGIDMVARARAAFGANTSVYFQLLPDVQSYLDSETGSSPKVSASLINAVSLINDSNPDTLNMLAEMASDGISPYQLNSQITRQAAIGTRGGTPQNNLQINRSRNYTGILPDLPAFYQVGYFKLPADLSTKLFGTSSNWLNIGNEIKTGQWQGNYGNGDFRIALQVIRFSSGVLDWHFYADNNANNGNDSTIPGYNGGVVVPFWGNYTTFAPGVDVKATNYPVVVNKWLKIEQYVKLASSYGATDGRAWVAITNMETMVRTLVFDHVGGGMRGAANLPITRILPTNAYTGGYDTGNLCSVKSAGIRIFDDCLYVQ